MERGRKYTWSAERGLHEINTETKREVEAPAVKVDEMAPMISHADCKIYTSKSAYRRSLREQGFIEVGNDVDGFKPKNFFETREYDEQLKEDLARSYYEVRDGMAPLSELDKERCKRVNKNTKRNDHDRRDRDRDGRVRD